jgi:aryl-alcohol dehydrogenase-like predicted oxidoreductase
VTKSRPFHQETLGKDEKNLLLSDFNNSLEILNLRKIYGVLVHNSIDLFKPGSEEIYDGLLWLKKNGFVDKIGVSVYTNDQLKRIIDNYDIDMVQLPFNIFDKRLLHSGMLNLLNKKNIEVHVRSVFLQGLLLIPAKKLPVKFNQWKSLWVFWNEWLKDNNLTALEASVRYALSKNEISKVIVGVHSKKHLHEIVLASSGHLPDIPNNLYTNDINLLNPSNW